MEEIATRVEIVTSSPLSRGTWGSVVRRETLFLFCLYKYCIIIFFHYLLISRCSK